MQFLFYMFVLVCSCEQMSSVKSKSFIPVERNSATYHGAYHLLVSSPNLSINSIRDSDAGLQNETVGNRKGIRDYRSKQLPVIDKNKYFHCSYLLLYFIYE